MRLWMNDGVYTTVRSMLRETGGRWSDFVLEAVKVHGGGCRCDQPLGRGEAFCVHVPDGLEKICPGITPEGIRGAIRAGYEEGKSAWLAARERDVLRVLMGLHGCGEDDARVIWNEKVAARKREINRDVNS